MVRDGLSGAGHERQSSLVALRGGHGHGDTPGTAVVVQLRCAGCIGIKVKLLMPRNWILRS